MLVGRNYTKWASGTINVVNDFGNASSLNANITITNGTWSNGAYTMALAYLTINGGTFNLGGGLITCARGGGSGGLVISAGTCEMNGNNIAMETNYSPTTSVTISGGVLNLSGQISNIQTTTISGGVINDTGSAGELQSSTITFTGGTSTIRKLTMGDFSQSSTSFVEITGSATWTGDWTMSGTDFTFKTAGIPTWSAGSLTMLKGGSWTFGG